MYQQTDKNICGIPMVRLISDGNLPSHNQALALEYSEIHFLITGYTQLNLDFEKLNFRVALYLSRRISRSPLELRSHVQRIQLHIRLRNTAGLEGAMLDLFIALGINGYDIRKRLLAISQPLLDPVVFRIFFDNLKLGLLETSPEVQTRESVLTKGFSGTNYLVTIEQKDQQTEDPITVANDYLEYGQIDYARQHLEEAVLEEPWRNDLHKELLDIYSATNDVAQCQAMYKKLSDKFIPDHHAWITTVERIQGRIGVAV